MADSLFGIPHIAYAKAQVNRNKSLDVSKLDVSFGGFTPMPLNDGKATREQVLSTEARIRERREAALREQALQDACTSDSRHFVDDAGMDWEYVVLSGSSIRIERCSHAKGEVAILDSIEGLPVRSLAPDACSSLEDVTSIVVPEEVQFIGGCAFRFCKRLECVVLPRNLATFESDWFRGCPSLSRLRMPGLLEEVGPSLFDIPHLEYVEFGAALSRVEPGTFQKSRLIEISIDPENPWLQTDGVAIYSKDAKTLVALAFVCRCAFVHHDRAEGVQLL